MAALLCALLALPLATASAAVPSAALAVPLIDGGGKPTPGSGIATKAALDNPKCQTGDTFGPYGQLDGPIVGGGPVCTRPFKAGDDNGGATSAGVTKDKISVVYVLGHMPETRAQPAINNQTGGPSTDEAAAHDLVLAMRPYYETWGRDIDIKFYTATGTDEAAQRADAVAIEAMKPFAVVNSYNAGSGTMAAELAKAKILVYDAETSQADFTALAPYLWGSTDSQVAVFNAAEVLGKQLVGKKAEYAGDGVKGQARKFGLITKDGDVDVDVFKKELAKYKGTISSEATYPPTGGTYGDAVLAGQAAPTIVSKMKAAGVTTMVLFTDAAMNKALMEQATQQEWFPEWFHTGNSYADYQAFAATLPKEQAEHFFGISGSSPYLTPQTDPETEAKGTAGDTLDWFWGPKNYSETARLGNGITWLLQGIHAAGPDLTPKTFQQGQFSVPPRGGSASNSPFGAMLGYGRTTGLPYDQYNRAPADYLLFWLAPDVEAPNATGTIAKPSSWFLNNAQRYRAGTYPTKKLAWFDKAKSVASFDALPPPLKTPVRTECDGCPSSGATSPTPGGQSSDGFVVPVPTASAS